MFNRFAERLEPRPDLEPRENEDADIFALVKMAIGEIRKVTDDLANGDVSVDDWHNVMEDILYAYHLAGWYVGAGIDADPDEEQLDRLAGVVAEQLEYLEGFKADLLNDDDDVMSMASRNRAEMYGRSVTQSVWRGRLHYLELPFYPTERCICRTNCTCGWLIEVVDGGYDATWKLSSVDHCDTCKERAKLKPLKIRNGEYDRGQITSKMYA